jgi:hypothetical protein
VKRHISVERSAWEIRPSFRAQQQMTVTQFCQEEEAKAVLFFFFEEGSQKRASLPTE